MSKRYIDLKGIRLDDYNLSKRQMEMLCLFYGLDWRKHFLSYKQIAERFDITPQTVKNTIEKAHNVIRNTIVIDNVRIDYAKNVYNNLIDITSTLNQREMIYLISYYKSTQIKNAEYMIKLLNLIIEDIT